MLSFRPSRGSSLAAIIIAGALVSGITNGLVPQSGLSIAHAQEADAAQQKAARAAIASTGATDAFDNILPQASLALKNRLSSNNPDKATEIDAIVDEETLALAGRRGALEAEAVKLFGANFTTEDLEKIAAFFETEAGKKYLKNTPVLARELSKAARVWSQGIQRDLGQNANKRVQELLAQ